MVYEFKMYIRDQFMFVQILKDVKFLISRGLFKDQSYFGKELNNTQSRSNLVSFKHEIHSSPNNDGNVIYCHVFAVLYYFQVSIAQMNNATDIDDEDEDNVPCLRNILQTVVDSANGTIQNVKCLSLS